MNLDLHIFANTRKQLWGLLLFFFISVPAFAQYSSQIGNYSYVDITQTGANLGNGDDDAFTINLGAPFPFYGVSHSVVQASTNGYLAFGGSLNDSGGDLTNDCPISSSFSSGDVASDRILFNQDDLRGTIYYQYFPIAPVVHPLGLSGLGASIIQQVGDHFGNTALVNQQAILFDDGTILLQFASAGEGGSSSSTGTAIGNGSSTVGENYTVSCDEAGSIPDNSAIVLVSLPALEIECRQPTSTSSPEGLCAATLDILPPFVLNGTAPYTITNDYNTQEGAINDAFPPGTTVINWTVTDDAGSTANCISLVHVEDTQAPLVGPCNTDVVFVPPFNCVGTIELDLAVTDNCGIANVDGLGTFTRPPGLYEFPITATDVHGNVEVHIVTVAVHDSHAPEFINCPEAPVELTAGSDGTAFYNANISATDNCGVTSVTNDQPLTGLPIGTNIVTYTANDNYGNWINCEVTVIVDGPIGMQPQGAIEASLADDETSQIVTWNALNAATSCELCTETTLEGFSYVGTWWGHQYFLANETSMSREAATIAAESFDAHLAVINDAAENAYLAETLGEDVRSAWIGLLPVQIDGEWTFAWDNGDAVDFTSLALDASEINADTRFILTEDGTWPDATNDEEKFFLIERPCVSFSQTGPIYQTTEEEEPVLLRSGDDWAEGTYEVTYDLTDMCGNTTIMTFPVDVLPEIADYCTTTGEDNSVWISGIAFHELVNSSSSDNGYADFTETTHEMNLGDGVVLVYLQPGGNENEEMLYWRIFGDRNLDGDFFDAGEVLFEGSNTEAFTANITLPLETVENMRLRVMVSRHAFAAPCGNPYIGEIEDYTVTLNTNPVQIERPDKLSVFPNPADNYINVSTQQYQGESVTLIVRDQLGKERYRKVVDQVATDRISLNLNKFIDGIYVVTLESQGKRSVTARFTVNKFYGWTPYGK